MNTQSEEKHITCPDGKGYQVRIVRKGKETSRYFSHNLWGSKEKALEEAKSWRDQRRNIYRLQRPLANQWQSTNKNIPRWAY